MEQRRQAGDVGLAESLLQDSAAVDHRIRIGALRGMTAKRRGRVCFEEPAERGKAAGFVIRRRGIGKGEQAPARVGLHHMAKMHRLAVGKPDNRCRVEPHADLETPCEVLMLPFASQVRRAVAHRNTCRVTAMLDKILLEFGGVGGIAVAIALADDPRPFLVEGDQVAGDLLAFLGIASKQRRIAAAAQHRGEFPAQIETVTHRDVHALAGLRAVCVAGIARDEDPRMACSGLAILQVVEPVGQALPDFIDGPPDNVLHLKIIGAENLLRGADQVLFGDIAIAHPFAFAEGLHLDIDPRHISAFARDDQQRSARIRLDQRLLPYIREIGDGEDVHHTPRLVG